MIVVMSVHTCDFSRAVPWRGVHGDVCRCLGVSELFQREFRVQRPRGRPHQHLTLPPPTLAHRRQRPGPLALRTAAFWQWAAGTARAASAQLPCRR
jgi:hypothetical protein